MSVRKVYDVQWIPRAKSRELQLAHFAAHGTTDGWDSELDASEYSIRSFDTLEEAWAFAWDLEDRFVQSMDYDPETGDYGNTDTHDKPKRRPAVKKRSLNRSRG